MVARGEPKGELSMGLFDKSKRKSAKSHDDVVYAFTLKIKSGETRIPAPMIGAYVVAYSIAETPEKALERSWRKLESMGYVVEDADPTGGSISVSDWDTHVSERWPDFVAHFPPQRSLASEVTKRDAIFSPFAGFE
jgi:hypothetical protein